jgi:hypothetical protein
MYSTTLSKSTKGNVKFHSFFFQKTAKIYFFFFTQFKIPPLGFMAWHLKCGLNLNASSEYVNCVTYYSSSHFNSFKE